MRSPRRKSIDRLDSQGTTALLRAVLEEGNSTAVSDLLARGADPNATVRFDRGGTALHPASSCGKLRYVKLLLEAGANPNLTDNGGDTPLHWACQEGYVNIIRCLLKAGADIEAQDCNGFTPLTRAYPLVSHIEPIAELLRQGANPNGKGYALHQAAAAGNISIIKLLTAIPGVDVHQKNKEGQTPLDSCKDRKDLKHAKVPRNRRKYTDYPAVYEYLIQLGAT